jgi:hypothetical protein
VRTTNPSAQQIQAFISDLLAGDELIMPLRDLVSRPCFGRLRKFAGTGSGSIELSAYVNEISRSYLPIVVAGIKEVLEGMLDLPRIADDAIAESRASQGEDPTSASSQGKAEPCIESRVEQEDYLKNIEDIRKQDANRKKSSRRRGSGMVIIGCTFTLVYASIGISFFGIRKLNFCGKEVERLNSLAKALPAYQTQAGSMHFTTPTGIVISPGEAAASDDPYRPVWESVYFVLTSIDHTTPAVQTAEQGAFIREVNNYVSTCQGLPK